MGRNWSALRPSERTPGDLGTSSAIIGRDGRRASRGGKGESKRTATGRRPANNANRQKSCNLSHYWRYPHFTKFRNGTLKILGKPMPVLSRKPGWASNPRCAAL